MSYSITKLIVSNWGKFVGIAPMTNGTFEIYNKKNELLGIMYYYKSWKELVWEQEECIIMSERCMIESFNLVKDYMEKESQEVKK